MMGQSNQTNDNLQPKQDSSRHIYRGFLQETTPERRKPLVVDVTKAKLEIQTQQPIPTNNKERLSRISSNSPTSPEFDSLTELPTPILNDTSFFPNSSHHTIINSPKKKLYGSLTIRPSMVQNGNTSNRIVSEFCPTNPLGNSSDHCNTSLDRKLSPQRRNVSSSDDSFLSHGLERESKNDTNQIKNLGLQSAFQPSQQIEIRNDQIQQNQINNNNSNKTTSITSYQGVDMDNNTWEWNHKKIIGKGTFSTVVLGEITDPVSSPKNLRQVAIKVVLLPSNREIRTGVESSLKRELEILKIIRHPSIINLLALNCTREKYLIYTPYHEGGDLFELASKQTLNLTPILIRRIFAEIAIGISYLHFNNIVHRDIKLENILINHKPEDLINMKEFDNKPIITITDFGLSRKIDLENPLLTTRCGSEDYVPPELMIGLPYDGRQTDSWALGVLLYSIMESRLPFDPPPSTVTTTSAKSIRNKSRVAHRIARIEWIWIKYSKENRGIKWYEKDWSEAINIVENLLIRREKRLTSFEICQFPYVSQILTDNFKEFSKIH
ncbi:hypothetical protein WICMUC_005210 [Wickerhamomyces mucosus]|uniref:Protein kinase domain-containing protein n=1 Tax=Wickerhamomyces mucosus TaxID=1378264 RepID=A0A9P8PA58_9ASCO|nr:hypothetical protein WICMUC_005210 [Wickerhamomyces mucosus]